MPDVLTESSPLQQERRHEGINWCAAVRVEKFSPDQVQWAAGKSGLLEPKARELRMLCGDPEEGTVERVGNVLVTVGLEQHHRADHRVRRDLAGPGAHDRGGGRVDG